MSTGSILAVSSLVAAAGFSWALYHGFRTGTMLMLWALADEVNRHDQPFQFWFAAVTNAFGICISLLAAAKFIGLF